MNEEKIWKITESVWQTITDACENYKNICSGLVFHKEKKEQFNSLYKEKYKDVMDMFMTEDTSELDSHKQAAILTICCLQLNIIEYTKSPSDNNDELCIIPQMIAIDVGLSYMLQCLNDILSKKNIKEHINQYYFPIALACNTPYEKIICRILYFEQNHIGNMDFNVLELADRYFLLEYLNLLQHGIEPPMIKES